MSTDLTATSLRAVFHQEADDALGTMEQALIALD